MSKTLEFLQDYLDTIPPDRESTYRGDLNHLVQELRDERNRRTRNPANFVAYSGEDTVHAFAFGNTKEEAIAKFEEEYDVSPDAVSHPVTPRFGEHVNVTSSRVIENAEDNADEYIFDGDWAVHLTWEEEKELDKILGDTIQRFLERKGKAYSHWAGHKSEN